MVDGAVCGHRDHASLQPNAFVIAVRVGWLAATTRAVTGCEEEGRGQQGGACGGPRVREGQIGPSWPAQRLLDLKPALYLEDNIMMAPPSPLFTHAKPHKKQKAP